MYCVYILASKRNGTFIWKEENLKAWRRQWKIELIEKNNPYWKDLFSEIIK